jgi:hypothetical protein
MDVVGQAVCLRRRFVPSAAASPARTASAPVAASGRVVAPVSGNEDLGVVAPVPRLAVDGAIIVVVVAGMVVVVVVVGADVAVTPSVVTGGAALHVSVTSATSLLPGPRVHVALAVMCNGPVAVVRSVMSALAMCGVGEP